MINQAVLGALLPYLVCVALYAHTRGRASLPFLILGPLSLLAGALWAVAPDLPRLVGAHTLYRHLAEAPWTDIFLFHYTIDQHETDSPLYLVLFGLFAASWLLAAWRELRLREAPCST
jgi:hypothetical protein